ncbi:HU family DNA-binding protein [Hazenella sp. IB182357]|uniref:HU family DNA-binding protein n=1 Tax=Polycladospora coralii TaxID=2771432 RepID=A0A926RUA9_9BACL|nr:HU family DNA-binding protein [Polycladospora coralii]MBD1372164.1 HU family DNA-binding protein [Polycladospora coralii]MBS7530663.1 HU family DNA-binding protein [Polycladospora coralii]
MNKTELIAQVAESTGMTKADTSKVIDEVFNNITKGLVDDGKVALIGFGNFEVRDRAARKGRNPQTGEEIDIPASKVPSFKAGKSLKDAVNK